MATISAPAKLTQMNAPAKPAQILLTRRSPACWRVTIDNPPINVMGPEMVKQFQEVMNALEADGQVRVVVFDSAVDEYFLNHSDFTAKIEDRRSMHVPNSWMLRMGRARSQVWLLGHGRKIGDEKRAARNRPRFEAERRWVCRMPSVA